MAKEGTLKKRILESISPLYNAEIQDDNKTEFTILAFPFTTKFCYFSIQKFKTANFIKISSVMILSKKIEDAVKTLSSDDLKSVTEQFQNIYLKHRREFLFGEEFKSMQTMTFLLSHNISMQRVLDTLYDDTMLFRETLQSLVEIDATIQSTPLDNTSNMFQ